MSDQKELRVAQELSNLPKILWFEIDEITVFLMPMTFFIMIQASMSHKMLGLLFSGVLAYIYRVHKENGARGYFFHLAYIWGLAKFEGFNTVKVKEYRE